MDAAPKGFLRKARDDRTQWPLQPRPPRPRDTPLQPSHTPPPGAPAVYRMQQPPCLPRRPHRLVGHRGGGARFLGGLRHPPGRQVRRRMWETQGAAAIAEFAHAHARGYKGADTRRGKVARDTRGAAAGVWKAVEIWKLLGRRGALLPPTVAITLEVVR